MFFILPYRLIKFYHQTINMMLLAILGCIYTIKHRFENTQDMYKIFEKLGFPLDNIQSIPHDKLGLLQATLSDPLCILIILLVGFSTFIAVILDLS
ncbi:MULTISPECIES: hypothetical protein [Staphylococcus]|uniref:hypothetical protein n=1 Tax=Staphylococcus TaxID=1279 RepID=UPI00189E4AAC|nr:MULTISPECIES: hypothetical protein [Staphylococcus]MBF7023281.1 hypothetical protein [Staphylococcus kloosii]MBF7025994.1 hypothetical protein [Staphylococcus kloosii]MCQ9289871.1 hypothetical protein [Staphylococcus gallinarum]MEC5302638.1 hypothetical protein [Staphylococcus shinii]